MKVAKQSRQHN